MAINLKALLHTIASYQSFPLSPSPSHNINISLIYNLLFQKEPHCKNNVSYKLIKKTQVHNQLSQQVTGLTSKLVESNGITLDL